MQFSLITPAYNRNDCIVNCINSVAEQLSEFDDFEQIIINDGSSDGTLRQIRELEKRFTFLKVISYANNAGVNYARNRGIDLASGDFIIFLDSDDTLNKGMLKRISDEVNRQKSYKHFLFKVSSNNDENISKGELTYEDILLGKVHGDYLHIVKSSFLKTYQFFEEFRAFEGLNWLRVIKVTQPLAIIPIQAVTVNIRNSDSLSRKIYKSVDHHVLLENFKAKSLFLKLYGMDLKRNSSKMFYRNVLLLFITGLRSKQFEQNCTLISEHLPNKVIQKLALLFNNKITSYLISRIYLIKYSFE